MNIALSRSAVRYGAAALAATAALVAAGCGSSDTHAGAGSSTHAANGSSTQTASGSSTHAANASSTEAANGSSTHAANGSSTGPISLPDRLGGFENAATVIQRHDPKAAGPAGRTYQDAERLTVAAYSLAYGGAAAGYRAYEDATLTNEVNVIAVRAPSPGLTAGPVYNPADLGLAVNQQEVHVFGDVACVVTDNLPVPSGSRVDPSSLSYTQCQRSGPHLTVTMFGNLQGDAGRREAVALTDGAYRATAAQGPSTSSIPAAGSSTEPISLPSRLGGFENAVTVIQRHTANAAAVASQRRIYRDAEHLTVAAYSRAYGGAAAAYRGYRDASMQSDVSVIAVRAHSPGLTAGPVAKPADIGFAANYREVHVFGDVACVVIDTEATAYGARVNPSDLLYEQCQRTGPHLTVTVFSNLKGDAGRSEAVALTDSAYRAVAGG